MCLTLSDHPTHNIPAVGIMLHCRSCGAVLPVPFVRRGVLGGSAEDFAEQAGLNRKHGCAEPWFHEEGRLRGSCAAAEFPEAVFANSALFSILDNINSRMEQIRRNVPASLRERAEAFLKRHTESYDVPALEADGIREILKDRNIRDAGRRKRLVKRNVSARGEAIGAALVAALRENVDVAGILAAFEDERRRLKERFAEILGRIDPSIRVRLSPCWGTGATAHHRLIRL